MNNPTRAAASARIATVVHWPHELKRRFVYLWPLKAVGTAGGIWLFFLAYFWVLKNPSQPPTTMPRIWVDALVPFTPAAFAIYASLWFFVSLPPALVGNWRALLHFGRWIMGLCLLCLAIFWALPTQVPPTQIDWSAYPSLAFLKSIDAAGNACPSLHVASAVFASAWLDRLLRTLRLPHAPVWAWACHLFCLAIVWSTLATLQHVALDALAGAMVGVLFAWLSLRRAPPL